MLSAPAGDPLPRAGANDTFSGSGAPGDEHRRDWACTVAIWVKGMRGQILVMMGRFDEAHALATELIAADEATVDVHSTACWRTQP